MANPITYERLITAGSAAGNTEHGIRIQNGCFAREFGTSEWTHIRVGIRYRFFDINKTGLTSIDGEPIFAVGFCNGTNNIPGDENWNNWVGVVTRGTSLLITDNTKMELQQVATGIYTGSNSQYNILNNIGENNNLANTSTPRYYMPMRTSSLSTFFLDLIKKDGGTVPEVLETGVFLRNTNISSFTDIYVSDVDFETELQAATPSLTDWIYNIYSGYSFTASYTAKPLNSVFAYWDRTDPALEITDLYVVRLA